MKKLLVLLFFIGPVFAIMPSALLDESHVAKEKQAPTKEKVVKKELTSVAIVESDLSKRLDAMDAVKKDSKKWAFIIAAEQYDETDNVKYSKQSGALFKQVAGKLLGVTDRRIYALIGEQATASKIKIHLRKLLKFVREGDTIYFYYSGHGIPDIDTKEPYLLPKDIDPSFVTDEPMLKLAYIYKKLSESKAGKVVAFIDSCFSGATDNRTLFKGVAAPRIKARQVAVDLNKMVVITAGEGKQFSNMYKDKEMRLFSYYLIENLIEGKRDVSSLFKKVKNDVEEKSFEFGDQYYQSPTLSGNAKLSF